jgi:hypothetical protein
MVDIKIRIERKRHDDRHWIKPSPPDKNTEQMFRVWFEGEDIGSWRVPECAAARWLVKHGKAQRSDMLVTFRGQSPTPSLTGKVGWFADHTVDEGDKRDGTPRFVKWRPMPEAVLARRGGGAKPASDDLEDE